MKRLVMVGWALVAGFTIGHESDAAPAAEESKCRYCCDTTDEEASCYSREAWCDVYVCQDGDQDFSGFEGQCACVITQFGEKCDEPPGDECESGSDEEKLAMMPAEAGIDGFARSGTGDKHRTVSPGYGVFTTCGGLISGLIMTRERAMAERRRTAALEL